MSGRAGYDIGVEIGKMMGHVFISRPAKIISKIGHILGLLLLAGGLLVMALDYYMETFDGKLALPCFLICLGGVTLLLLLHWIALRIDKKYAPKK